MISRKTMRRLEQRAGAPDPGESVPDDLLTYVYHEDGTVETPRFNWVMTAMKDRRRHISMETWAAEFDRL